MMAAPVSPPWPKQPGMGIRQAATPMLRHYREAAGLRHRELALKAGLSPNTLTRLESGQSRARWPTVQKIAVALNVSPTQLVEQTPPSDVAGDGVSVPYSSLQRDLVALPRLESVRLDMGVSREALARRAGLGLATVRDLERNCKSARLSTAGKLAKALGVDVSDLMETQPPVSRLRQARYCAGLSIVDLTAKTGVSRKAILLLERGARPAKLSTLAKLAKALQVELLDLLDDEPELHGLRRSRMAAGLTMEQLEARSGVGRWIIREIEERRRQADPAILTRLATALGLNPSELHC